MKNRRNSSKWGKLVSFYKRDLFSMLGSISAAMALSVSMTQLFNTVGEEISREQAETQTVSELLELKLALSDLELALINSGKTSQAIIESNGSELDVPGELIEKLKVRLEQINLDEIRLEVNNALEEVEQVENIKAEETKSIPLSQSGISFISMAYASEQEQASLHSSVGTLKNKFAHELVLYGVFFLLGIVYILCVYRAVFSTKGGNKKAAEDHMKTLNGFFIGVVTTMIGS